MNEEQLKIVITAAVSEAVKNIDKVKDTVNDFEGEVKDASKAADEAFKSIGDATKKAMKAVSAAVLAGSAALVGMAESTRDYRNAQSKLNTAFEEAGSSAEVAYKVYDELNGVLGESDVAVEAANHLAKLTTNEKELAELTDICTGVYAEFGDSLPIEGLTEAINHTAKLGSVQGNLADALEWSGVNVDDFNEELAKCSDEQKRQQLIVKTLSGLYKDSANRFKENNKEIISANKATEKWNKSMAALGSKVEPAITAFKEFGATLLNKLGKPIEKVVNIVTDDLLPILEDIVNFISDNSELVISAIAGITAGMVAYKTASYASKLATEGLTIAQVAATAAQKALNAVMNANPIGLVITAITALTVGLIAYASATSDAGADVDILTEKERELVDSIDDTTEAIENRKTAYEEQAGTIQAEMGHTKDLTDELLKLVGANGEVQEADRARVDFILGELNEALGTEYQMVDGIIQNYAELKDSIYEVINAKTANALLDAKNEEYIAAIQGETEALDAVRAAQKDYEHQLGVTTEAKNAYAEYSAEIDKKIANGYTLSVYEQERLGDLQYAWLSEQKVLDEKKDAYDKAAENYGKYCNIITDYEDAQVAILEGNSEKAIEILKNKGEAHSEYANDVDAATAQVLTTLENEAIRTGAEAERIRYNFEKGVEGYTKEMGDEAEKAHEDAMGAWSDAYDEAYGIGGDIGEGVKVGLLDKKSALISRATEIIASIWSAMRSEADSHSPSKKTMRLGKDMGVGLEIGMEDMIDENERAAEKLIQKSLKPIEANIKAFEFGDLDGAFSPAISATGNFKADSLFKIIAPENNSEQNKTPIILEVDGKVFAETAISTINQRTRQTGRLQLVLA